MLQITDLFRQLAKRLTQGRLQLTWFKSPHPGLSFYAFVAKAKRFADKSNVYYLAAWQRRHGAAELKALPLNVLVIPHGSSLFQALAYSESKQVD